MMPVLFLIFCKNISCILCVSLEKDGTLCDNCEEILFAEKSGQRKGMT